MLCPMFDGQSHADYFPSRCLSTNWQYSQIEVYSNSLFTRIKDLCLSNDFLESMYINEGSNFFWEISQEMGISFSLHNFPALISSSAMRNLPGNPVDFQSTSSALFTLSLNLTKDE